MKRQTRYWDSDCFLGWLKGEPDKIEACKGVVAAAEKGEVLIVTSALTVAEVVKLKHKPPIPIEHSEKVRNFFARHDLIEVRDVNRYLAEDARELVWENQGVKPKDAIHLATAMKFDITIFDTFDVDLIKLDGKLGNPPMRIGKPNILYQEQEEMFPEDDSGKDSETEVRDPIVFRQFGPISDDAEGTT